MLKLTTYLFISLYTLGGLQAQDIATDTAYAAPSGDTVGSIKEILEEGDDEKSSDQSQKSFNFDPIFPMDKEAVVARKVDDSTVNKMRNDDNFWYVNLAPKREEPKLQQESALEKLAKQKWFRNLLWVLIVGGFVAVLIWFIVSSDIQLFKKQSVAIIKEEEDDLINQSIFDISYDQEIQKAINSQNFRLAIRLLYLQTLKRLAEENIIQYKQERTNNDYVMQLYNTGYYKDFFQLTRHFEYTWYGQFAVAQTSFDVIKSDFYSFKQRFLS